MKKFAIIHGDIKTDLQKRAIEELTSILLEATGEYPVCFNEKDFSGGNDFKRIYIGTKESNPYIEKTTEQSNLKPEGYCIKVKDNVVTIAGYDDAGVLYGVLDFYNKYCIKNEYTDDSAVYWRNFLSLDVLEDFEYSSAPTTKERGLWTWGHVIYDYRGYLHNMMKLKMNKVIIWNDFVPTNIDDIIEYAHSCNIKVVLGFEWLWDTDCARFDLEALEGESEKIFSKYEREYAKLALDGIYFQTFTELYTEKIGNKLIAEAATDFVNKTSALFFEKYPDLNLEFGLHAMSVEKRLDFIKKVDKRIKIVWEDCGAFPFSYIPFHVDKFDETLSLVKNISHLRGEDDNFGVVTKGLVKLDWNYFEHPLGAQCIGISSKKMKKNRIDRKENIWRYVQAGWLVNADKALAMIKEMCALKNGELSILALVEDGMFEENIMFPVALYSEMLWNCNSNIDEIMREVSLRNYVSFA